MSSKSFQNASNLNGIVSVLQFGADPTGAADSTGAFQAVLSATETNKGLTCNVPKGTYLLSGPFSQGAGFVVWNFAQGTTLTGAGATSLPFIPQKVQLDGTPVSPTVPYSTYIQGTSSTPRTNLNKKTPVIYVERHTNSNPADSSDWGNPRNSSPVEIENIVYGNETGSQHSIIGRVFSSFAKAVGSAYQSLVSASFLAQSNAPSGSDNRDCWGANIVVASSTGNAPTNLVGIEVDEIGSQAMPLARPGVPGAFNATAYWAQAASEVSNSNTGLYVSSVSPTYGWLYGAVFDAPFYDYISFFKTSLNAPSSKGVRIETQWQSSTGRVLECYAGPSEQFRIDGESTNPIWILVGGALKKIEVGAVDSGGTGYRALRVLN
jgi:hypothetical protein